MRRLLAACLSAAIILLTNVALGQSIRLAVDLSDAPRNIFHSKLTLAARPGPLTLVYPKWIPGNHRPSGPIANLTGLKITAGGQSIKWQRDPIDMYAFHLEVPAGAKDLQVSFDTITSGDSAGATGAAASTNVLDLNWNQVVLYPQGTNSDAVEFEASVHLPAGWKFGTALPIKNQSDEIVEFNPVSLTQLVDSPLIAGDNYRQIGLNLTREDPVHVIDMVAESEAALAMTPQQTAAYHSLVAEAGALFGARHYTKYHFLYTLSDEVGHHGLEHHESSDNSVAERTLIDPELRLMEAGLLPHEFVHSWNGKYRRPAGLATPNYQEPMIGDLLWVYEGLTEYLGNVLTARSKLWTPEQYREALAETAAMLDHRAGRTWRPLEDTARSVQSLRLMGPRWQSWRRGLDYYPEGELIWLDVDTLIRQQTHGQKSLDDFCRLFYGGPSSPPKVVPYTFDDIVRTLNQVASYDWDKLLKQRVNAIGARAPLNGIEQGGWRLVYTQNPSALIDAEEKQGKYINTFYSLGFLVRESGELEDVIPGSPAYDAGIGPGMKLVAVNGRRWSKHVLRDALRASLEKEQHIDLLVENAEFFKTYSIIYSGGEKYPHLVRAEGPDLLINILNPLVK